MLTGSNPTEAVWKTFAISFTALCQCLSEETLKAVGPFLPCAIINCSEVKYVTKGVNDSSNIYYGVCQTRHGRIVVSDARNDDQLICIIDLIQ